jgi:hypothetical protein
MTRETASRNKKNLSRTSLRRGFIALFVAPALAVVPLSLLFLAVDVGGQWDASVSIRNLRGLLPLAAMTVAMVAGTTIVLGGPTWIILRLIRRESALAYALAGLVLGLAWAFWFGYSGEGALRVDQMMAFGLCSVTGGLVALGFWFIARDPRAGNDP